MTLGLGLFIGGIVSGRVVEAFTSGHGPAAHQWRAIWLVPAAGAALILVVFAVLFRPAGRAAVAQSLPVGAS